MVRSFGGGGTLPSARFIEELLEEELEAALGRGRYERGAGRGTAMAIGRASW